MGAFLFSDVMWMSSNARTKNGSARRRLRLWLKAQGRPCWICGAPIDYSLPAGHPYSFEVDELVPVSKGGSPIDRSNVDASHRACNQWRGNKDVAEVLAITRDTRERMPEQPVDETTSREW